MFMFQYFYIKLLPFSLYALNESNSQQNLFEDIGIVIDTSKKLSCTSKKLLFFYKGRDG